ncbi:MAG: histidine kinase dimerization/phosphoacceptor domain -containing protein [Bacteroidota bacterium]
MRKSFTSCFVFLIAFQCYSQKYSSKFNYNVPKLRLLIETSGLYLYAANQGLIDYDSAMVLACNAQNLPVSLWYDEGYNEDNTLPGNDPIDKEDIRTVKALLSNLKNADRLKQLFAIAGYYLFKPGDKISDLGAAWNYLQQARQLSDSLKIIQWSSLSWVLLGKYYVQKNDFIKSKECLLQAVREAKTSGKSDLIAFALDNLGTFLPYSDSTKIIALSNAMSLYERLNMKEKESEMLMKIIGIYFWGGKIDLAMKKLYESQALQKSIGFKHTHYTETTIAYLELMKGNMNKALPYAVEGVKTMEAAADTVFADLFYIRLGNVYHNLGRFEEAINLYKRCIESGRKNPNNGMWYKSFLSTITSLTEMGKETEALTFIETMTKDFPPTNTFDKMFLAQMTGDCYNALGQTELAEKSYAAMILSADQLSSLETRPDVGWCYAIAAAFYSKKGQASKAQHYVNKVLSLPSAKERVYTARLVELASFRIDSVNGKYLSSIGHYQHYKELNDSVFNLSKNKQIEELQIQYETEKKEQNIKLLESQSKSQQGELDRSRLLRNLILGGLFLLIVVIALLYNRYRLKQRTNKQLEILVEEKQGLIEDKEWLVKEIHHRVKNNLQIVISLMNIQSTYLESGAALDAIRESQSRMNAMSLIHQKLYQSSSLVAINMQSYIGELIRYLLENFAGNQNIKPEIDITAVELDVSQAIPIGLILNEAITNSIKYAFPVSKKGQITIVLKPKERDNWTLTIADNGVGLPGGFDFGKSETIGMMLIRTLCEQIGGTLSLKNEGGLEIMICFMKEISVKTRLKSDI